MDKYVYVRPINPQEIARANRKFGSDPVTKAFPSSVKKVSTRPVNYGHIKFVPSGLVRSR